MIVDEHRSAIPAGSRIFEVADEFSFFGIDTDNGKVSALESGAQYGDVVKLLIAVGTGIGGAHFVVNPEGVLHLVQQAGDGIGRNTDSYLIEKASDFAGGSATPL